MLTCPRCTQENPEGFRFCGRCGSPLEAVEPRQDIRKTVTILFCDLCGSTALGHKLDPEALRATLATGDCVEARLASRCGDEARALQLARRAVEQAEATDFWVLRGNAREALAEVLAGTRDLDEARDAQRRAIEIYEAKGVTVESERARALLAEI